MYIVTLPLILYLEIIDVYYLAWICIMCVCVYISYLQTQHYRSIRTHGCENMSSDNFFLGVLTTGKHAHTVRICIKIGSHSSINSIYIVL